MKDFFCLLRGVRSAISADGAGKKARIRQVNPPSTGESVPFRGRNRPVLACGGNEQNRSHSHGHGGMSAAPETITQRIQVAMPGLSRLQRRLAEAYLEDPARFANGMLGDISAATDASEPSIVRFCVRLGYSGYREFRQHAIRELEHRQNGEPTREGEEVRQALLNGEREAGRLSMTEIRELLRLSAVDALDVAFGGTNDRAAETIAQAIAQARRVVILGIGGSSAIIAQEAHNRLFRLNIACNAYNDSYMQRMAAATLGRGDVAFFISSTGWPRSLLDSAELARHYGASCVGICPTDSPLGRVLDTRISIGAEAAREIDRFQPSPLRYAQLFVLDAIAFRVASLLERQADQSLARARASVAALHGVIPHQPIGD